MPRKSRKQKPMVPCIATEPEVVGYVRLSVSDNEESNSIKNQKFIIELWGDQHQMPISHFYIDDGYSGSSFERPAFKELLQDINDGKVCCVVVKDLSRLGRDLITTSYYIEEYLPSRKVRFVSVNDHFDTVDGINDQSGNASSRIRIPMINVFNEQVSVDTKKKVEMVLDMKAQHGAFIGPSAPFGYKKSEEDHTCIVPDAEAAEIVKRIFQMAANNVGITAIVRYLNKNAIPTPIQYARSRGLTGNYDDGNGSWNTRSVKYILTNRTYTGVLVQGKEKRVVEGTHEPLVDINNFEKIQHGLQARAFNLTPGEPTTENILKGKVVCGCCGGKMQRKRGSNHADWYFFTCITNNRLGGDKCTGMYVREEDIFSAMYYQLKLYVKEHFISAPQHEQQVLQIQDQIAQASRLFDEATDNAMRHLEKYNDGEICVDEFKAAQTIARAHFANIEVEKSKLEECEQTYQHFVRFRKVCDKELPLTEIIDEIHEIRVDSGRRVMVQWK